MSTKHSISGRLSFVTFIVFIIFMIFMIADLKISEYSFYDEIPLFSQLRQYISVIIVLLLFICFISGIFSLFNKESNKLFPTITLSVVSFILFVLILFHLQETLSEYYIDKGVITNYGIFDIPTKKNTANEIETLFEQRYLVSNTENIPATLGMRFGFNYVIYGEPYDEVISVMKVTKYPKPGVIKNDKVIQADTSYFSVSLNELRYSGFRFDNDYELVIGDWEFEMWYKNKKLLSKKFIVVQRNEDAI